MSAEDVAAYLWHGYLPPRDIPEWFPVIFEGGYEGRKYTPLAASEVLDALFDRLVPNISPPYIVPISGGWDSRLILAALRERSDDITTVTLGTPGQLDYEVGATVAKAAGVDHYPISLEHLTLDWADLVEAARRAPWTSIPDAYFLSAAYMQVRCDVGNCTVWSGFLGEALTGGHYKEDAFVSEVDHIARSYQFTQCRVRQSVVEKPVVPSYPRAPAWWTNIASEREFLDFCVRQRGCIAPIVLGSAWRGWHADQGDCQPGLRVIAPYADAGWAGYWLRSPRELHRNQQLYYKMAEMRFPDLFRLPSKYSWGVNRHRKMRQGYIRYSRALRNRLHRHFPCLPIRSGIADNYIDFQWAFRKREDYIAIVNRAVDVLKERDAVPWVDLDRIWREHYRGRCDHSQTLQILLGLAVNLEAQSERG